MAPEIFFILVIMIIRKALTEIGPPIPRLIPVMVTVKRASQLDQHRPVAKAVHRIAVDIDAHRLRPSAVLRQCAHRAVGLGILHESDEARR